MPSVKSVHLPYRGVISSQELQGYFNSILQDISQLEERVKQLEGVMSHGYVYGCRLEYDIQTRALTVHDGFFVWNGDLRFVTKIVAVLDLEDGDVVHLDPEQNQVVLVQKTVLDNCVPLGQYVNRQFSYQVRKHFEKVDARQQGTRMIVEDIPENQVGKHLDIAYSLDRLNMQMYSQQRSEWLYVARPDLVKTELIQQDTPVTMYGLLLHSQKIVYGPFQPSHVLFVYSYEQALSNLKVCQEVNGILTQEQNLESARQRTVKLSVGFQTGYNELQVRILRREGTQPATVPQGFQYTIYVVY